MCINTSLVKNPYTSRFLRVNCGHCPACEQAKAAQRASRIRNNNDGKRIALFFTLTYTNDYVPYVTRQDLEDLPYTRTLPIRRDTTCRYVRSGHSYRQVCRRQSTPGAIIDNIDFIDDDDLPVYDVSNMRHLRYERDKFSICYYPDGQKFIKRLRDFLSRSNDSKVDFSYFLCSEYGGRSHRAHLHGLLFIDPAHEKIVRNCMLKAWPYASRARTRQFIEIARDCASYVSSYVNGHSDFSAILKLKETRQKHSYSKSFGTVLRDFSLPKILEKVDSGALEYAVSKTVDGFPTVVNVPIPKYVIDRFFPRFKGYSRFAPDTLANLLRFPASYRLYTKLLRLTDDDIHRFEVRHRHALQTFQDLTGRTMDDFVYYYQKVWQVRSSNIIRRSLETVRFNSDWLDFYDNVSAYKTGGCHSPSLDALGFDKSVYNDDPNRLSYRVIQTHRLEDVYYKMSKEKYVTNEIMSKYLTLDV